MPVYKFRAYVPVFRSSGTVESGSIEVDISNRPKKPAQYMEIAMDKLSNLEIVRRWKFNVLWTATIPNDLDPEVTAKLKNQRDSVSAYESYVVFTAEINYKDKEKPAERFFEALRERLVKELDEDPYIYSYKNANTRQGSYSVMLDAGVAIFAFSEKVPMVLLQTTLAVELFPEDSNDDSLYEALQKGKYKTNGVFRELEDWYRKEIAKQSNHPGSSLFVEARPSSSIQNDKKSRDYSRLYLNVEAKVPKSEVDVMVEETKQRLAESLREEREWITLYTIFGSVGGVGVRPLQGSLVHTVTSLSESSGLRESGQSSQRADLSSPYVSTRDRANGSPVVEEDTPDAESSKMTLEELRAEVNRLQKQIEGAK